MTHHDIYLICGEHLEEIKIFLSKFFEEKKDEYIHPNEITFLTPDGYFLINLIEGANQPLTQNVTLEILYKSMEELKKFAKNNKLKVKKILVTGTERPYTCHHVEILSPQNICKIAVNYCEKP